jgi:hypothetical protein
MSLNLDKESQLAELDDCSLPFVTWHSHRKGNIALAIKPFWLDRTFRRVPDLGTAFCSFNVILALRNQWKLFERELEVGKNLSSSNVMDSQSLNGCDHKISEVRIEIGRKPRILILGAFSSIDCLMGIIKET